VLLVLIGAAVGVLLGYWFRGFLDRDKCLDVGGRWNVERGFCANCGTPVQPGQRFCGHCGTRLDEGCPNCGAENPPGNRFCGTCGTQLFSEARENIEYMVVRVGTLDDADGIVPDIVIWTDSAPAWARIDPAMTAYPRQPG
jgi:hypothetical protein